VRKSRTLLSFRRGQPETGQVSGSAQRLDLLQSLIGDGSVSDVGSIILPRDAATFAAKREAVLTEVQILLQQGRELVERIERLVCALFDVPDELADEVVEHAVTRAAAGAPMEE
jgi:hypothetical protein